jgi:ATPase subunit of ABC transporter with duplicated ATPase domains
MKDRNDSDARGMGANYRAESAEKRLGRAVASARSRMERTQEQVQEAQVERQRGGDVEVRGGSAPVPHVVRLQNEDVCHPDGTVHLAGVTLAVARGDRIHVQGANGAGKSTLLNALRAACRLPRERVLHLPQDVDESERVALLQELEARIREERGEVLAWVSLLGADPSVLLRSACPSPGEARKLALALGLSRPSHLLLLDEPQNHLDLPAVDRLATALAAYPGALVLTTHDPALAARCTTQVWRVAQGRVTALG